MIRRLFRHLWESIRGLKRNGLLTLGAMTLVSITLFLVGLFAAVLLNTEKIASGIEGNVPIHVFLPVDSTDAKETIRDDNNNQPIPNPDYHHVYQAIQAIDGVDAITFSSKDEQLASLQERAGDTWDLYDEDSNPLSDLYIVKVGSAQKIKQIAAEINQLAGVDEVDYGGIDSERLFKLARMIRLWGLAGTALLVFIAILLISTSVRSTILARRTDIEIMRLVGATNSYIRWPFFLEGAWIGLLGSVLPITLLVFLYHLAYDYLLPSLNEQGLDLYQPQVAMVYGAGALLLIGMVIGSLGSMLSMRRFLKI